MGFLEPERYFSRISHIDVQRDLLDLGLRHVLLDIDNTILARDTHAVPRDVAVWLGKARTAGIDFCLVSNNWHESVLELAAELELPIVAKAMKPLPHGFVLGMRKLKAKSANTVVIGDQLSTDIVGAHVVGLVAYMLQPLAEQDLRHTLVLRNIERAILGDREPEPAPACWDEPGSHVLAPGCDSACTVGFADAAVASGADFRCRGAATCGVSRGKGVE